jgi:hypothetical protein
MFLLIVIIITFLSFNSLRTEDFVKKIQNIHFAPINGWIEKETVQSESAPKELSNE